MTGEIFGDRRLELIGGRQVDIAVGDIHRCAAEHAFALEIGPLLLGQHLEGRRGGHSDGVSVAGASTAASSLPSTASSSPSSISAAETTCSLFATSNRRSEERRVGNKCVSTCTHGWSKSP